MSTTELDLQPVRDRIVARMEHASPPVTQTELAKAMQAIEGKVRSRIYLNRVLNGHEDAKDHTPDYLARVEATLDHMKAHDPTRFANGTRK